MLTESSFLQPLCCKSQSSASNVCIQPCSAHCASNGVPVTQSRKKGYTFQVLKKGKGRKRKMKKGNKIKVCLHVLVGWLAGLLSRRFSPEFPQIRKVRNN